MFKLLALLIGTLTYVNGHGLMLEPIAMSAKLVWNFDPSGVKDYDAHGPFVEVFRTHILTIIITLLSFPNAVYVGIVLMDHLIMNQMENFMMTVS